MATIYTATRKINVSETMDEIEHRIKSKDGRFIPVTVANEVLTNGVWSVVRTRILLSVYDIEIMAPNNADITIKE